MKLMKYRLAFMALVFSIPPGIAQNVGIGTSNPVARLHVADSNVLFTGPLNVINTTPANPPVQGPGARMMWYPQKAAFRAGLAYGLQWDKDSMGIMSIGLGNSTKAIGESAFASGAGTNATGVRSTAMGDFTTASGYGSFAIGTNTLAAGSYSVAMGTSSSATGFTSFAFGQAAKSSSNTSIAMGISANASGFSSIALGQNAEAAGQGAVALGTDTKAPGLYALAAGFRSQASGDISVAIGNETRARSYGSISIGSLNDTSDVVVPGFSNPTDRLFQLGNGTVAGRSNAITVLQNGNTGIGTVTPVAALHVQDKNVLFMAAYPTNPNAGSPPVEGAGSRMFWFAAKAALRAGTVSGGQWDYLNIGTYSIATGNNNTASGESSASFGFGNTASGYTAFTAGSGNVASAFYSAAIGENLAAKARGATAIGANNDNADNPNSATPASSDRIFQVGNGSSSGARSNAITILRNGNVGIGSTNPQQTLEVVAGPSAIPTKLVIANKGGFGPAALEFVSDYGLSSQWRPGYIQSGDLGTFTGRLEFFTNGSGSNNLYGAVKGFEVRNGTALTATGTVGSYSDERLKENVAPFTDGLNVIEQINPVQFQYKPDAPFATHEKQVGIIAQELEKTAPYMVHQTSENGVNDLRWVDNQAYIFLLINAVKEQQQLIKAMQQKIDELSKK
jgi:hypothetical protein